MDKDYFNEVKKYFGTNISDKELEEKLTYFIDRPYQLKEPEYYEDELKSIEKEYKKLLDNYEQRLMFDDGDWRTLEGIQFACETLNNEILFSNNADIVRECGNLTLTAMLIIDQIERFKKFVSAQSVFVKNKLKFKDNENLDINVLKANESVLKALIEEPSRLDNNDFIRKSDKTLEHAKILLGEISKLIELSA